MSAPVPLIELHNVERVYRMGDTNVRALNGVDLTIGEGEFWAVMGASGSGKSTLLNVLGCLDRCTGGSYRLLQQDTGSLDDDALSHIRLRQIGFIFQSFNLIPQLTVARNIELPLYYLGWDVERSRDRARELAKEVGLADRLQHKPSELSGGQQQRVAIARALANDPPMLLADEPTGNLDSATGVQIMEMLEGLHRKGKTIIMVTHEEDVAQSAEHILHMRDGKIHTIKHREGEA